MGCCGSSEGGQLSAEVLEGRLGRAKRTGSLSLAGVRLGAKAPIGVYAIDTLRVLDLSNTGIEVLGEDGVEEWVVKLRRLRVCGNRLRGLCNALGNAPLLEELDASSNLLELDQVTTLPSSLQTLSFSKNPTLGGIPSVVFRECLKLRRLDVSGVGLRLLPPDIASLHDLRELIADDNPELGSLGGVEWERLESLSLVSVKQCALTGRSAEFPPSLFLNTKLHTLHLEGCPTTARLLGQLEGWEEFEARRRKNLDRGKRVE